MSSESREKARKHGQKSGTGTPIVSRILGRLTDDDEDDARRR